MSPVPDLCGRDTKRANDTRQFTFVPTTESRRWKERLTAIHDWRRGRKLPRFASLASRSKPLGARCEHCFRTWRVIRLRMSGEHLHCCRMQTTALKKKGKSG